MQLTPEQLARLGQPPLGSAAPADDGPPDVVFYTGCNVLKTPHITLLCLLKHGSAEEPLFVFLHLVHLLKTEDLGHGYDFRETKNRAFEIIEHLGGMPKTVVSGTIVQRRTLKPLSPVPLEMTKQANCFP